MYIYNGQYSLNANNCLTTATCEPTTYPSQKYQFYMSDTSLWVLLTTAFWDYSMLALSRCNILCALRFLSLKRCWPLSLSCICKKFIFPNHWLERVTQYFFLNLSIFCFLLFTTGYMPAFWTVHLCITSSKLALLSHKQCIHLLYSICG